METADEDLGAPPTSHKTLSDIRELLDQCKRLLQEWPKDNAADPDGCAKEISDTMAALNIWAANMGLLPQGRRLLASRLSHPQVSRLAQQLLMALQRDLGKYRFLHIQRRPECNQTETEKATIQGDAEDELPADADSDDSSDRSTESYRLAPESDDENAVPSSPPTIWDSINGFVHRLRQLESSVRRAGAQHRQERIQRFRNMDRNIQVYELFERCARQRVDHLFPSASLVLRERMAESVATRRLRFLYLEKHEEKKALALKKPEPDFEDDDVPEEEDNAPSPFEPEQQQEHRNLPFRHCDPGPSVQPSVMLSNTVDTRLDPTRIRMDEKTPKRAESVASVKVSTGQLPPIPRLNPCGTSFFCPYCFVVCPAEEASGQRQWM